MPALRAKLLHDLVGYLQGNSDYSYRQDALTSTSYLVDLSFTLDNEDAYYQPKDVDGLPVREYVSVGRQYNPTRIAAYALAHYNRYLDRENEQDREIFFRSAEWFMRNQDGRWRYEFDWGELRAPWLSAMAQGEGISVLVRAWHLSNEDRYLEQALRALEPFIQPIEEGGVLSQLDSGDPFLEEYPTPKPVHVLNGFLYAVIGLADLERISGQVPSKGLRAADWLNILEKHLRDWDLGFWSAYDLSADRFGLRNATTVSYHRLHITQLRFLGEWASSDTMLAVANRWEAYSQSTLNRLRALTLKVRYRLSERAQR